jgi:hypothetical protein
MKSKHKYKYLLGLILAFAMSAGFVSCSDDENGKPFISYIRVTDPTASDSLLVSAGQGQMVSIMGGHLGSIRELWFNNRQAQLIPTFITNTTVISVVPQLNPTVVTNKIKMVFANGDSLLYDFNVDISAPELDHARSEYVNEGDSLIIYGNYFYAPVTVKFSGGVEGEVLFIAEDAKTLAVKVPAGAQPGSVTVSTNFGETESNFWFADNRGIVANFEGPFTSGAWRGNDFVVESDPAISNINGKFVRINKGQMGAYPYFEVYGGPVASGGSINAVTKNLPEAALLNPSAYSLKFEINTLQPITGAYMRLYFGTDDGSAFGDARNNTYYTWQPNLDTKGVWQTITIPWEDVYTANKMFSYNSDGYGMYIYFHGPNPAIYNFAFDNFRVVPNTNE